MLKRVFKDSIVYGVGQVGSRFIGVLLAPFYTHFLSTEEYGKLDLLTTLSAILVLLACMQVESGVLRGYYEAKREGKDGTLASTGFVLFMYGGVAWMCVGLSVFAFYAGPDAAISWRHVLPVVVGVIPQQCLLYGLLLLQLEQRAGRYATIVIGDMLTSGALGVAVVAGGWCGAEYVLWSLTVSKLLWGAVSIIPRRRELLLRWNKNFAREILLYGLPILPAVICGWMLTSANRLILLTSFPFSELAVFGLAAKIGAVMAIVSQAFRLAWAPNAMQLIGQPRSEEQVVRVFGYYLIVMTGAGTILGSLGYLAAKAIAPPAYYDAGAIVGFIAMGHVWAGATAVLGYGVNAVRKTYLNTIPTFVGAAVNVVICWFGVREFGLVGAGIAFLAGTVTTAIGVLVLSQCCYRLPFNATTIGVSLGVCVLLACMGAVLPLLDSDWLSVAQASLHRLVLSLVFWVIVIWACLAPQDRRRIARRVGSRLVGILGS